MSVRGPIRLEVPKANAACSLVQRVPVRTRFGSSPQKLSRLPASELVGF